MAYIYANLVKNQKKTIEQVPKNLRAEVEEILNTMGYYNNEV